MNILLNFIRKNIIPDETQLIHSTLQKESIVNPLMVDVGACQGDALMPFLNDKWIVHAFEPDRNNYILLKERTLNHSIIINSKAVSNKVQDQVAFFSSQESVGVGSLLKFSNNHQYSHEVEVTTLGLYCSENNIDKIDFLKVDVEGYDKLVLEGLDWDSIKPSIIMCEYEDKKTKKLNYSMHDLILLLEDRGYKVMVSVWYPLNKYGGAHKWEKFVYSDFETISDDTWGNIIATNNDKLWNQLLIKAQSYSFIWSFNIYYFIRNWTN